MDRSVEVYYTMSHKMMANMNFEQMTDYAEPGLSFAEPYLALYLIALLTSLTT